MMATKMNAKNSAEEREKAWLASQRGSGHPSASVSEAIRKIFLPYFDKVTHVCV